MEVLEYDLETKTTGTGVLSGSYNICTTGTGVLSGAYNYG
jgi:hypothetical protein